MILGHGSNLLINPQNKQDFFVKLDAGFSDFYSKDNQVRVNAAWDVNALIVAAKQVGLGGLEFAAGVPASVGGMTVMNFGCFGKSWAGFVKKVRVVDEHGKDFWLNNYELEYGYRTSIFQKKKWVLVEIILELADRSIGEIEAKVVQMVGLRKAKQPLGEYTFGSIFENPAEISAGAIIDQLGYKGRQIGDAKISEKHANFMINMGNASFEDAVSLIEEIKKVVKQHRGIDLSLEVKII